MRSLLRRLAAATAVLLGTVSFASAQSPADVAAEVDAVYAQADALYRDLHRQPELSGHEEKTAATLAAGLKALGYEVTTGVGKTGIVGVLKNGAGPVVLLRTELDGLPVEEKTGLDYASTARTKDDNGVDVGLMHACGHDVHMAAWMTTARIMAGARTRWAGTLVLIGQPAEETLRGAQWMIEDGLLTRFPKPDFALAVHDDPRYPAGVIGYRAGPLLANSDMLRITIFGAGGHGARPETTVDPVVIAARTVLALQTIVSREVSPFDAAVITVGTIHAGTRANIIPAEARLELSVRSLTDKVRAHLLSAIERVVKAEAAGRAVAQGADRRAHRRHRRAGQRSRAHAAGVGGTAARAGIRAGEGSGAGNGQRGLRALPPRGHSDPDAACRHRRAEGVRGRREGWHHAAVPAFAALRTGPRTYPQDRHRGGGAQPARADARPRRIVVRHPRPVGCVLTPSLAPGAHQPAPGRGRAAARPARCPRTP